jgi:hypothetical protein
MAYQLSAEKDSKLWAIRLPRFRKQPQMQPDDIWVSIAIDAVHDHLYKADLLIRTLDRNGRIPPGRVIVQHVNQLPAAASETFARMGCKTRQIEPFLDGKYCNKLRQLCAFDELGVSESGGLLLLDVDVAVTAPLTILDRNQVAGKLVDAPNPPLHVLTKIFQAAGVALPETVECDWNIGETIASNFNGGVLYIPSALAEPIDQAWRRFACFLFNNSHLFENDEQRKHMDQVSLALALGSIGAPYSHLRANSNFPTHSDMVPRTFDAQSPVEALHYHWDLDDFGFLRPTLKLAALEAAIGAANECAVTCSNIEFYRHFKLGRASRLNCPDDTLAKYSSVQDILEWLRSADHHPKLVFHAGTPKTGTTALQFFLENNRDKLAQRGTWYPETHEGPVPKHQFLVEQLIGGDVQGFGMAVLSALRTMPANTTLVLFSTEGLFNHWWDFAAESRSMFRFLASMFSLEILTCFRDPVDFAVSMYRQNIRNPPHHRCYGRDLSLEDMMQDAWFNRHLDYVGFLMEVHHSIGNVDIRLFNYSNTVISEILRYLAAGDLEYANERRNESLHRQGLEMMRIVNRYRLEPKIRGEILLKILEIENMFGKQLEAYQPSEDMIRTIDRLTHKNSCLLRTYGGDIEALTTFEPARPKGAENRR